MAQVKYEEIVLELMSGGVISLVGEMKAGTPVKVQLPKSKVFVPAKAGEWPLKNGGIIRTDISGKIIEVTGLNKMSSDIHPARAFMAIEVPRVWMAFSTEKFYLSTGEEITLSEGLTTGSLVQRIDKAPENKTPVTMESGIYRMKTGEYIYVNKDAKIYRIIKGGKITMKTAFIDNPGIKGPNELEIQLKDGTKAIAVGGLKPKGILMTQETNGTQIPFNKGVYELADKRFVLIEEGGVIVKIATDRPKPAANYSALKYEMNSKRMEARKKLINSFNAIRK